MKYLVCIKLLILLVPSISLAQDEHHHEEQKKATGVEALSDGLRQLLSQEMQALQTGMMAIIPANVSGNWEEIEGIAGKIKNSYILKQSLTESQVHELHSLLPSAFIEKDQRLHYLAGMLEHAAQKKKPELVNFYFSEMNEACVSCHVQFATHKFPKLLPSEEKNQHSH